MRARTHRWRVRTLRFGAVRPPQSIENTADPGVTEPCGCGRTGGASVRGDVGRGIGGRFEMVMDRKWNFDWDGMEWKWGGIGVEM